LKNRYRDRTIGWSTHENPDDHIPITVAVSKGTRMFERHVGIETADFKLNKYSSNPNQIEIWIEAYFKALEICGSDDRKIDIEEKNALDKLRRGIFLNKEIKKNNAIKYSDVFFAIPFVEHQLTSGEWKNGIIAKTGFKKDEAILTQEIKIPEDKDHMILKNAIHKVKALLNEARVYLNSEFEVEYSHHYGISNFDEYGAVIINCINRDYCKKILVQIPGQKHPAHYHPLKEESFQLLYGDLSLSVDGRIKHLTPGETCLVMPGVWHSFWTENGCVFEEVSTTHFNSDSVYKDSKINKLLRSERKTIVDHWGRFQIK
jgi:N-acetylneuraminate synthase